MINEELEKFNFNKSSIGYKYVIQCIIEVYKNQKRLNNIEKDLLPCVAEKLNVKDSKIIKWTLRKMIISMVRYTDTKTIQQYFPLHTCLIKGGLLSNTTVEDTTVDFNAANKTYTYNMESHATGKYYYYFSTLGQYYYGSFYADPVTMTSYD